MKSHEIILVLREDILSGRLAAGERLPPRTELLQRFQTTPVTLQRAVDQLVRDGYLATADRSGTYVNDHLPFLSHYALVFPDPADLAGSTFYAAIRNEAVKLQQPTRRFSCYYGIDGHTDVPDYQRLVDDVRAHRLGGVIFATNPFQIAQSPVLEEPGIPRVTVASWSETFATPRIYPDLDAFLPRAFDFLVAQGRRRIAVITMAHSEAAEQIARVQAVAAARKLDVPPQWVQGGHPDAPAWAGQIVRLLMSAGKQERPDGLIITDDNLVESATGGLVAAGMQAPHDVLVVAHTNFPWPAQSQTPVTRLGYDVRRLLADAVTSLELQREGAPPPPMIFLPPVFEDELPA